MPARTVAETVTTCGYSSPISWGYDDAGNIVMIPSTSVYSCTSEIVYTYYPATAEVAATPYVAPTAAEFTVWKNSGWNSHASTIGGLVVGTYLQFTVAQLTRAAILAVAAPGMEGSVYTAFPQGILVDSNGIQVIESGVITMLQSSRLASEWVRIYRLTDGRVVYLTQQGNFHISATVPNPAAPLVVYGLLYDGYDEISSASFVTGMVTTDTAATLYGSGAVSAQVATVASMTGAGSFVAVAGEAGFSTALLTGSGELTGSSRAKYIEATLTGWGALFSEADVGGSASASIMALMSLGGDYDYSLGTSSLPTMTSFGESGFFTPPILTEGYGQLPQFVGYATGYENDIGAGSSSLPTMLTLGGDYDYGVGSVTLPVMYQTGSYGNLYAPDELWLISGAATASKYAQATDLVMVLNSSGDVTSTFSMTREQALAFMSSMNTTATLAIVGTFGLTLVSDARGSSWQLLQVGTEAALYEGGVVWVVNMGTGASSQYETFGFNSFFERDGVVHGVAGDGIYVIRGATDAGALIDAVAVIGKSKFGDNHKKRVNAVYIAAVSAEKMVLRVDVGAESVYYTARNSAEDIENHRVDIGKGLSGTHWQFSIYNKNGGEFDLDGLEFTPVSLSRSM